MEDGLSVDMSHFIRFPHSSATGYRTVSPPSRGRTCAFRARRQRTGRLAPGTILEHRAFLDLIRKEGVRVLRVRDLLQDAVENARRAGELEPWIRETFPSQAERIAPLLDRVNADTILQLSDSLFHRTGEFDLLFLPVASMYWCRDFAVSTPRGIIIGSGQAFARSLESGIGPQADPEPADPLARQQPLLAELYGASVSGRIATGPSAGRRITTLGDRIEVENIEVEKGGDSCCATVSGVSLHAEVRIPRRDRFRLEKLCRQASRPPSAQERLSLLPDGRLLYRLKRAWRNGTTHVV